MALIQKDGISFPNKKFSYKTLVIIKTIWQKVEH